MWGSLGEPSREIGRSLSTFIPTTASAARATGTEDLCENELAITKAQFYYSKKECRTEAGHGWMGVL